MPTTTTAPTATKTTASPATAKAAKPRKPLPAPNSDFYYLYETLAGGGTRDRQARTRIHGNQSRPCYHRLLG